MREPPLPLMLREGYMRALYEQTREIEKHTFVDEDGVKHYDPNFTKT